jgi:hypothetical protein
MGQVSSEVHDDAHRPSSHLVSIEHQQYSQSRVRLAPHPFYYRPFSLHHHPHHHSFQRTLHLSLLLSDFGVLLPEAILPGGHVH